MRILPESALLGARTLLVDGQGDGDFSAIQDALDHAAQYASQAAPWSVRVAPGVYPENLALRDWVDLQGLGPGTASLVSPPSGSAIASPASCTVAHLALAAEDAAVVRTGISFSGRLDLDSVFIDQTVLDIYSLQHESGALRVRGCWLAAGGALYLGGGTLQARHSQVFNQAAQDSGANMALYIRGGSLQLQWCAVENLSPAGYGVYIDQAVTALKAYHCTFRRSTSTYAIHATLSTLFSLACCAGNAGLHPNLSGYHDYVQDASL